MKTPQQLAEKERLERLPQQQERHRQIESWLEREAERLTSEGGTIELTSIYPEDVNYVKEYLGRYGWSCTYERKEEWWWSMTAKSETHYYWDLFHIRSK
ncbi:hypothetical protein HYX14_02130 [Candidatus Woesearchaeota archaeon]|nr:hypothetical protein [Candidatus Woesearchaeota archaeon]